MKRIYPILILIVLTTLMATPLLAAGYVIQINVIESAGNSYTQLPIIATLNNTYLAANGLIASNALDTRVINSANVTLPHMVADNKTLFVDNITGSSTAVFQYKSGQSALASLPIIVGNGGYVTRDDDAKLEPGDYFDLEESLYLNTTGTKLNKADALKLSYNVTTSTLTLGVGAELAPSLTLTATGVTAGEHTVGITAVPGISGVPTTEYLRPTGDGVAHPPNRFPNAAYSSADYSYVDEAVTDEDTTYLYNFSSTDTSGYFTTSSTPASTDIYSVSAYVRGKTSSDFGSTMRIYPKLYIGSTLYSGTVQSDNHSTIPEVMESDYHNFWTTWLTNPATGSLWQTADFATLQFGYFFDNGQGLGYEKVTQVYLVVNGGTYDEVQLHLLVDGVIADTDVLTAPVPDNGNAWIFYPDPYIDYITLETGN